MDRNNVGEESPVRHVSMLTSSDCCLRPRMRSDGGMHVCSWAQYTVSKQAPYREAMKGKRTSEHRPARSLCSLLIIFLPRMGRSVYADVRSTSARALHAPTSAPPCGDAALDPHRHRVRVRRAGIVFSLSPSRHHPSLLCVCDPSSLYSAVCVLRSTLTRFLMSRTVSFFSVRLSFHHRCPRPSFTANMIRITKKPEAS